MLQTQFSFVKSKRNYQSLKLIPLLLLTVFSFTHHVSHAQQPQSNFNQNSKSLESLENKSKANVGVIEPQKISKTIDAQSRFKLEQSLKKQDYISFYDEFAKFKLIPQEQQKFLEKKLYDGHAPLYWLYADLSAQLGNEYDTHKWLYVAIIMTKQDSELCLDSTAKQAVNNLLRAFPKAVDISRATPQNVKPAMNEVIFFMNNLKQRSNPIWACEYGNLKINSTHKPLEPEVRWDATRKRVFQEFTKDFNK